jgi:ribonuclease P protein component
VPAPLAGAESPPSAGEPLGTTPAARRPFAFPRERRVTRGPELDAVRQRGKRVRVEHLDVRFLPTSTTRAGVVVPRHKHSAVDRNRLKRRLRELVRTRLLPTLPPGAGCDVVIRARVEAYGDSFEALGSQIDRAAREIARLLNPELTPGT